MEDRFVVGVGTELHVDPGDVSSHPATRQRDRPTDGHSLVLCRRYGFVGVAQCWNCRIVCKEGLHQCYDRDDCRVWYTDVWNNYSNAAWCFV